jgi:hypothetical protein
VNSALGKVLTLVSWLRSDDSPGVLPLSSLCMRVSEWCHVKCVRCERCNESAERVESVAGVEKRRPKTSTTLSRIAFNLALLGSLHAIDDDSRKGGPGGSGGQQLSPRGMKQQSKSPRSIVKCRKHVGDVRLNMFERWGRCRRERPLPRREFVIRSRALIG